MKKTILVLMIAVCLAVPLFASCRSAGNESPEAAIQNWMDTWAKADLEALLKLTSPAFQADSASVHFYETEYSHYTKLSYSNLQLAVVDAKSDKVLVEARFNYELESFSSTPNVAGTVTRGTARHVYALVNIDGKWMVDSIERYPG
jgi:predicted lipid-binding transport protein (Tim44 family)